MTDLFQILPLPRYRNIKEFRILFPQIRDGSLTKYAHLFYLDHPVCYKVPRFKNGGLQKSDLAVGACVATIPRAGSAASGGPARYPGALQFSPYPVRWEPWEHLGLHPWLCSTKRSYES